VSPLLRKTCQRGATHFHRHQAECYSSDIIGRG
jgi:hypothetical protein